MTASAVVTGVDALVWLLLARRRLDERDGLTTAAMVSGYPGSPLGTFDLTLDAQGPDVLGKHRIIHRPGLNEERNSPANPTRTPDDSSRSECRTRQS